MACYSIFGSGSPSLGSLSVCLSFLCLSESLHLHAITISAGLSVYMCLSPPRSLFHPLAPGPLYLFPLPGDLPLQTSRGLLSHFLQGSSQMSPSQRGRPWLSNWEGGCPPPPAFPTPFPVLTSLSPFLSPDIPFYLVCPLKCHVPRAGASIFHSVPYLQHQEQCLVICGQLKKLAERIIERVSLPLSFCVSIAPCPPAFHFVPVSCLPLSLGLPVSPGLCLGL